MRSGFDNTRGRRSLRELVGRDSCGPVRWRPPLLRSVLLDLDTDSHGQRAIRIVLNLDRKIAARRKFHREIIYSELHIHVAKKTKRRLIRVDRYRQSLPGTCTDDVSSAFLFGDRS